MQQETTIMPEVHCETQQIRKDILKKNRGQLTSGIVILCDNARPYTATRTRVLLEHFNRELFDHPPYSPDISVSYYHLFNYNSRFNNNEELMEGV
jgi:transposase